MCERIKTINRHYKALEYEINRQEALKKISTLHNELKFKDNNNFSDRFLQTASLIEKNSFIFKSACDHVDIVTTLVVHLYSIGTKLMFANNSCSILDVNIIYIMTIICEEHEIPLLLKRGIINNSKLTFVNDLYKPLISDYVMEMIVFGDSDLYAVISYLKIKPSFLLKIKNIFVEESIEQEFLWLIEKNFQYVFKNLPISIFYSRKDLLLTYSSNSSNLNMISIWSEDITSAKALAMMLRKDIIFINSHLEFGSCIIFPCNALRSVFDLVNFYNFVQFEDGEKINPDACAGSIYNFFYDGTWQYPVKNTYWMYNDNICAQATKEDVDKCVMSATEAFKIWSNLSVTSRIEILHKLASTLECNGKFLLAKTVSEWIKLSKIFENMLICQDERLESVIIHAPKGIVSLHHEDEVVLFSYLTLSLIVGNCVIVLCNQFSCNLAPYCNIFSASEIPPGVLNLLSNRDMFSQIKCPNYTSKNLICASTKSKNIVLPLK